jgi:Ser/Thr protein kinase RdoA (MazF antagonist)
MKLVLSQGGGRNIKLMMNLRNMVNGLVSDSISKRFVESWEHDEGTLKFWRASSNFVYVFERNENRYYLRFSFEQENSVEQIHEELNYMQYLIRHGYPSVVPVPSDNGRLIETVVTSDGLYFGVVFSQANGSALHIEKMNEEQFEQWGKSLASLHILAKTYRSNDVKRKNWQDILESVDTILQRYPLEQEAKTELERVKSWIHSLTFSNDNFGLIHYDFQLDNVFWDENEHHFNVFDFDDSMYHWFAMDIVTSLKDLYENDVQEAGAKIESFLRGYCSILPLDDNLVSLFPRFLRFSQLYSFSRLLWSLENSDIDNAPEWYDGLKTKLKCVIDEIRLGFGHPW